MNGLTRLLLVGLLALSALLPACGSYKLQGRVVRGPSPQVAVVDADDPRLEEPGVPVASIQLALDPRSLNRKSLPGGHSDADGRFAIPIEEFGAGLLEYDIQVVARKRDLNTAIGIIRLPGSSGRLLIVLGPGPDRYRPPEDPLDDLRHMPMH